VGNNVEGTVYWPGFSHSLEHDVRKFQEN